MVSVKIILALGLIAVFIFKFSGLEKTKQAISNVKENKASVQKNLGELKDEFKTSASTERNVEDK